MNNEKTYQFTKIDIDQETFDLINYMENKYPEMTSEFVKISVDNYLTFLRKQKDYGPTNIAMNTNLETKDDLMISLSGLVTRMNDKMSRLINLILKNRNSPENESVEDSFKDISVYGIISKIVINKKWGK